MGEHFNNLSPEQAEALALLAEECGEVIQVIGKILRHGLHSCHPSGGPNNQALLEELLAICEKAVAGPWRVHRGSVFGHDEYVVLDDNDMWVAEFGNDKASAELTALARSALPDALREIERLRGLLAEACKVADGLVDLAAPGLDTFRDLAITDIARIREEAGGE